jgi:hypothetical protein
MTTGRSHEGETVVEGEERGEGQSKRQTQIKRIEGNFE